MKESFELMTLGRFIDALEKCDPQSNIYFDFCGFVPTEFFSYRGFYDQLALGFDNLQKNVADILGLAREAVGKSFEGWKGGSFTMSSNTPIWVSLPSACFGTGIFAVKDTGLSVIIMTRHFDV